MPKERNYYGGTKRDLFVVSSPMMSPRHIVTMHGVPVCNYTGRII